MSLWVKMYLLFVFQCILNKITQMDQVHFCLCVCVGICFGMTNNLIRNTFYYWNKMHNVTLGNACGFRGHLTWIKGVIKAIPRFTWITMVSFALQRAINRDHLYSRRHLTHVAPQTEKLILSKSSPFTLAFPF